jgi:hypothetical protein
MSDYQRQSAIALDRYDLEERTLRELIIEVERRMRLRENPWLACGGVRGKFQ